MAKSLLDDAGFDAIGKKRAGPVDSGKSRDRVKLAVALAAIVIVASGLTYYYDWLGLRAASDRRSYEAQAEKHKKAFEQQEKERQEDELKPDTIKGAS